MGIRRVPSLQSGSTRLTEGYVGISRAAVRIRDTAHRMLHHDTRAGLTIADTVASFTRSTTWELGDDAALCQRDRLGDALV